MIPAKAVLLYAALTGPLAIFENPTVVGLIVGAPALLFTYLAWQRTREMDRDTQVEVIEAEEDRDIEQLVTGLKGLVEAQAGELTRLYERVEKLEQEIGRLRQG